MPDGGQPALIRPDRKIVVETDEGGILLGDQLPVTKAGDDDQAMNKLNELQHD